jgi:heat shock protein HslJ
MMKIGLMFAMLCVVTLGACRDWFVPVDPKPQTYHAITDKSWCLVTIIGADGQVVKVDPNAHVGISFAADGSVRGYTGCNPFRGTYRAAAGRISASVETYRAGMMCITGQYEAQYVAVLNGAVGYTTPSPDQVVIRDAAGNTLEFRLCN